MGAAVAIFGLQPLEPHPQPLPQQQCRHHRSRPSIGGAAGASAAGCVSASICSGSGASANTLAITALGEHIGHHDHIGHGTKISFGILRPSAVPASMQLPCGPCLLFFLATMALGLLELGGFDYAPHTAIATAEARCHEQTDRNLTCRSIVNLHDGTQLLSSLTEGLGPEVRDCWRWKSDSAEQQSSRAAILVVGARSYLLAWRGRC